MRALWVQVGRPREAAAHPFAFKPLLSHLRPAHGRACVILLPASGSFQTPLLCSATPARR